MLFLMIASLRAVQRADLGTAAAARVHIAKTTPIKNDRIVFMHYSDKYQCNPKYICEEP